MAFVLSAALVFTGTSPIAAAPPREPATPTATKSVGAPAAKPELSAKRVSAARAEAARAVDLPRPVHGATAIRLLGDDVDEAAALNELSVDELVDLLRSDPTAWVDSEGAIFFKDPAATGTATGRMPAASAPLDQTFTLHSKPGSKKTIFLDFNGANVSASRWHTEISSAISTVQPAWDPSGNGPGFDNTELTNIQSIWASVVEDYAPFDVDVTTADPGAAAINRASSGDDVYGSHVVVSPDTTASTAICGNACGGVAYRSSFGNPAGGAGGDGYGWQQPAWVFPHKLGPNDPKSIAEAISHEAGHQLGMQHDGTGAIVNNDYGYYAGHGAWAPIMGVGYDRPITQWSKGDYTGANNHEDDIATLTTALGLRGDIAGSSVARAELFPSATSTNHITSRSDVDVYLLGTCTGNISVSANPIPSQSNLDIKLTLLSATNVALASADPASGFSSASEATGMGATLSQSVPAGTYYVAVDGTGPGGASTGYDDYGSLGAYTMSKTGCDGIPPTGVPSAPTALGATPDPVSPSVTLRWGAPTTAGNGGAVTGYLLSRSGSDDVVVLPAGSTSYTWTGLQFTTGYTFAVTALNAKGPGALASITTTTSTGTVPPSAPQGLTLTWNPVAQNAVVAWSPPATTGTSALQYYTLYIGGSVYNSYTPDTLALEFSGFQPSTTYSFGVSATSAAGTSAITTTTVTIPARAANDGFAQRTTLSGVSGTVTGNNLESSAEANEPVPTATRTGAGKASVWYSWTAPASGPVTMTTTSSVTDRDTILGVYQGTAVGSLTKVAGNDEPSGGGHLAAVTFDATAGTTYAVAVDGYRTFATGVGPFSLTWSGTAVGPKATTTALTVAVTGRSATITATVTAAVGKAAGYLDIYEGSTYLLSAFVDASASSRSTTQFNLTRGDHTYTARFTPYDTNQFDASDAAPKTVTIAGTPTVTTLQGSAEAQLVTLTAAVTPQAGTAAGTVEFREGSTLVGTGTVANGTSTVSVVDVTPGTHLYRATFVPSDPQRYDGSTSSVSSVTVPPYAPAKATTTSLSGVVDGRSATLSAVVAAVGATPSGSIQFSDGGTVVGAVPTTSGAASLVVGDLTRGTHHFTATFVPSNPIAYETSTSSDTPLEVAATPTTTSLTASLSARTVTLQTSVSPSVPGTVEVRDGSTLVGTVALSSGSGQLVVNAAVGAHHYTATFVPADDLRHAGSTSTTRDVTINPAVTTTGLGSAVSFHRVTLTSTVTSTFGAAAGSVTFREGSVVVGSAAVSAGTAATVLTDVPTGAHTYQATFTPTDPTDQGGSVSAIHTATVAATPTATDLAVTVDGQDVTLDVGVTTTNGVLDGTVELREGSTLLDTQTLVAGATSLELSGVAPGVHGYVATFVPSTTTHATSSSPTRTATVSVATATTLSSSVDGRTVTLDAEVTGPGTPTGSVQFRDGSVLVGTAALSAGKASVAVANVAPGTHSYTATFVATDPAVYAGSVSSPQVVDVDRVNTTTALVASVNGRDVTLTTTVSAGSGSLAGTVQLRDGGNLVGVRTLGANGSVAVTLTSVAHGPHSYTATFLPDGTTHNGSTSPAQAVTVLGSTTTTLTAGASGRTVTLTAVVGTDGTAPPGNVTFYRGTTTPFATAPIVDGKAVLVISDVVPGDYTYSARYTPPTGTTSHAASASAAVAVTVDKVTSTTALQATIVDQAVTLDATVTVALGTPAGSVQFRDGATIVGTVTVVSGAARLTLANVLPGDHTYTASFVPNTPTIFTGSISPEQTVNAARIPTTTGLQAAATGQTVTLTATPSGGARTITGSVEFYEGTTLLGTVPVAGASVVLTVTDVEPGSHTYSATLVPTGTTHTGSTSPTRTVAVGVRATTTVLSVAADVRTVTLNAAITAGARKPAGTVVFKEGSTVLGTVTVDDGTATLSLTMVEPWAHSYTATFTPADPALYAGSVSPSKLIIVDPIVTTTDLTASYAGGLRVNLTAPVTGASGTPSGTVTFREGSTVVGTAAVFAGLPGTASVLDVSPGEHTYQATFVPTYPTTYAGSVSTTRTVTVDPVPTTTTLAATALDDTVTLQAGLNAAVAGDIVFREDDTVVGTVPVVGKAAALTLEHVATGAHIYTATFVPTDRAWYAGSVSPSRTAIVKVLTTTALTGSAVQRTVTLSADVAGAGSPAGDVVFRDGGAVVGTVAVASGSAALTLTGVVPGTHDYRATFVPASSDYVVGSVSPVRSVTVDPIPTTTVLTSDVDGRSVTLTAAVTGSSGSPVGTVVFREGDTVVRSVAVSSGAASAVLTGVTPGTHTYRASFVPANAVTYVASESDPESTTVAPIGTDTSLEVVVDGRSVTLDSTVASSYATPAGEVVFREGDDVVGRADLASGAASTTLTGVEPGEHTYTATYVPADAETHAGSVSPERTVTVAATGTETRLSVHADVRTVTLGADVSATDGTPSGDVEFREGAEVVGTIALDDGVAVLELSDVDPGEHTYTATFVPTSPVRFSGSVSPERTVTVDPIVTTTDMSADVDVRTVTLDAEVTSASGTPAGDVVFRDDEDVVGTVALDDGKAALEITDVHPGGHTYTATFVPADSVRFGGSVSADRTVRVAPIVTGTDLAARVDVRTVTLDAEVTSVSGTPTGAIEFREGADLVGTVDVADGAASLEVPHVAPGEHTYAATYVPADPVTYAASASGERTVTIDPIVTTTELTATPDGLDVTLDVLVTGASGSPTGEVVLRAGDDVLDTLQLDAGAASVVLEDLAPGDYTYSATYVPGDATTYAASDSGVRTVTVGRIATTTELTGTVEDRTVTLTATVDTELGDLDGEVSFYDEYYGDLGSSPLVDGTATMTLRRVAPGGHPYLATFRPSGTAHAPSEGRRTLTVSNELVKTVPSLQVTVAKRDVTLRAQVDSSDGPADGYVYLMDGDNFVAYGELVGGVYEETLTKVRVGTHHYWVEYHSYDPFASSASERQAVDVKGEPSTTAVTATADGDQVTLSALVSAETGVPFGMITFYEGDTALAEEQFTDDGKVGLVVRQVLGGSHTYRAVFTPYVYAPEFEGSSGSALVTVDPTTTTTELTTQRSKRSVTLTAAVDAPIGEPAGSVEFRDAGIVVATVPVAGGEASTTRPAVTTGVHDYAAVFVPTDATVHAGSESAKRLTMPSSDTSTALEVTSLRTTVTFDIAVTSPDGDPAGRVEISENGAVVTDAELDEGAVTLALPGVAPGQHAYVATYVPVDDTFAGSASAPRSITVTDTIPAATTTTALTAGASGRTVTLTAAVGASSGTPAGTVQFTEDGTFIGSVTLTAGAAALTRPAVAAGPHTYRATFVATDPAAYEDSQSAARQLTVAPTATTTTLTGAMSGTGASLKVAVAGVAGLVPTGIVRVLDGTVSVGQVQLDGAGKATLVVPAVTVGSHSYRATFVPSTGDFTGSSSAAVAITVKPAASKTTLTAPAKAKAGSSPTVKVKVLRGAAAAAGKVLLTYGTKKVTLTLKSGQVSFKLPKVKKGTLKVTASYLGDATTAKSSATRSIKVTK